MFWKKKEKALKAAVANPAKPSREDILAQAKANMATARAEIGDETLEKIKAAFLKKQSSIVERAKAEIRNVDHDKVRDHLKYIIREDKGGG